MDLAELDIQRVLRRACDGDPSDAAAPARKTDARARRRVDQILDCAVGMFNQVGVASVSTNHIAAELSISPGNLHYHYRTKGDLLRAAFARLDEELRVACQHPPQPLGVADFVDWQIAMQSTLWRHRYFVGSLEAALKSAPELRIPWLTLQRDIVAKLATAQEHYVRTGHMSRPRVPNTVMMVAQNSWMLWMSWIRWHILALGGRSPDEREEREIIHQLVWQHFSFYEPYHNRSERASAALRHRLAERLGHEPADRP